MKSLDELEHSLNPLSVKEAARIYGDSASNFYRMVRRGEVPGVFRKTPKGRIKICPREFVPWIRAQFAAFRGASNGAVQTESKGNEMTPFVEKHEQDRSLSELNGSEKNRREGNVA
ncbi:MAG TPA: helix-turn-helix domain-containing protein [Candidatus Angelobacter sp.]